jgi:hypothetical protein
MTEQYREESFEEALYELEDFIKVLCIMATTHFFPRLKILINFQPLHPSPPEEP